MSINTTPPDDAMKAQAAIFGKMARVMARVRNIAKEGVNVQQNYKFVKSDDLLDMVRQAMAEERLVLLVSVINSDIQKTEKVTRAVISYEFSLCCADTGAVISTEWIGMADDYSDKAVNKAATAAQKYWLLKTFLIGAEDPDAESPGLDERQPARAVRWYKTDALDRLVERSRARDYITRNQGADELLALLGEGVTWSDFASVTEAAEAIKASVGRAKRAEAGAEDMTM